MVTHRFGKYPIVRIDRDGSTNMGLYDLTVDEVALLEGLGPGVYVLSPELSDYAGVFSPRGGNWVDAAGMRMVPGPIPGVDLRMVEKSFKEHYSLWMGDVAWEYALIRAYGRGDSHHLGNLVAHMLRSATTTSRAYWYGEVFLMLVAYSRFLIGYYVDDREQAFGRFVPKNRDSILGALRRRYVYISPNTNLIAQSITQGGLFWWGNITPETRKMMCSMTHGEVMDLCRTPGIIPHLGHDTDPMVRESRIREMLETLRGENVDSTHGRIMALINDPDRDVPKGVSRAEVVHDYLGSALFVTENTPKGMVDRLLTRMEELEGLSAFEIMCLMYAATHPTYLVRTGSTADVVELITEALENKDENAIGFTLLLKEIITTYDGPLPTLKEWRQAVEYGGGDFLFMEGSAMVIQSVSPTVRQRSISRDVIGDLVAFRHKYEAAKSDYASQYQWPPR